MAPLGVWVNGEHFSVGQIFVILRYYNKFHFQIIFLPLDEAIASRAVFVIVSGSDGRKRFWSQLNYPKTVRDRPYVSMGS